MNNLIDIISGFVSAHPVIFILIAVLAVLAAVFGIWLLHRLVSREIFTYLIAGVLTTIVNLLASFLLHDIAGWNENSVTIAAWIIAVGFAYIINNSWVFQSERIGFKKELAKILKFTGARLLTYVIEALGVFVFITCLGFNFWAVKIILIVIVTVLNYFFSKYLIFIREKKKDEA